MFNYSTLCGWQTEDHSIYEFHKIYGDEVVKTILARAMQAAGRGGGFVKKRKGNVLRVAFGMCA